MRFLMLFLLAAGAVSATIIPADRRIDWNPGIPGGIPDVPRVCSVKDFGAKGDGTTDDYRAFDNAIKSVSGTGAVFVPAGTYLIKSTLSLKSGVVLRGAGHDKTKLHFNLPVIDTGDPLYGGCAIAVKGDSPGTWTDATAGYGAGSSSVTVANGSLFSVGDFAEIQQDNDAGVMYTRDLWDADWADASVGQVVKVTGKSGNVLTVNPALRHTYKASLNPQVRKQPCVENAGIEKLYMKLTGAADITTVEFIGAAYCWIRECESAYSCKTHARFFNSFRCEVRDSYFHHASDYGGGGHGYGVEFSTHVSDCLAENNVFSHLRHAMIIQLGANGNVFGYNYSRENYTTDNFTPCDISMHGHYPYMNLFEANCVQEIDISDWWGPCGPGNTVLRNVVEREGIDVLDESHYQNLVGNVIENRDNISIESGCNNTLAHGNYVNGQTVWSSSISDRTIPASYYLSGKPSFFGNTAWPVTGADLVSASGVLPAKQRYLDGTPVAVTGDSVVTPPDTVVTTVPDDTVYVGGIGVIASADDGNIPANTLDGNADTRWSAEGDGQWIQYDLGSVKSVSGVSIAFFRGDERFSTFDVSVSEDGTSWNNALTAAAGSGSSLNPEMFPFGMSVPARYIRITGQGNSDNDWNSFTEVRIDTADGNVSGLHERSGMLQRNGRSVNRMFSITGHRVRYGSSKNRAIFLEYDRNGNILKVPFYGSAFRGNR